MMKMMKVTKMIFMVVEDEDSEYNDNEFLDESKNTAFVTVPERVV